MNKPILITWGFDQRKGSIYLDCFLDIKKEKDASNVKPIFTRAKFTNANASLLHVPEELEREELEAWITCDALRDEVIKKLRLSLVSESDIARVKKGTNTMDFILGD